MPDLSARPDAPASHPVREPLHGTIADRIRDQLREPTDLDVAIRIGQRMLDRYGTVDGSSIYDYIAAHSGLAESLRILLRALDAERGDQS